MIVVIRDDEYQDGDALLHREIWGHTGRDLIQSEKRKESIKEGFLEEEAAKLNFQR